MGAFRLLLVSVAVVLVFAAQEDEHHLDIKASDKNAVTSESIDINYKGKYVKISSPKQQGTQSGSLLHDYIQGLNVLKQHGVCFILDKFKVIPEDIKDWERVEASVTSDIFPDNGRHAHYGYTALPYLVNRTTSPKSVQDFCPGPIRVVVLDDVVERNDDVKTDAGDDEESRDNEESRDSDDDEEQSRDASESSETRGEVGDNVEDLPTDIFIPEAPLTPEDQSHDREKRGWRRRRRRRFWRRVGRVVRRVRVRVGWTRRDGWRVGLGKKKR